MKVWAIWVVCDSAEEARVSKLKWQATEHGAKYLFRAVAIPRRDDNTGFIYAVQFQER